MGIEIYLVSFTFSALCFVLYGMVQCNRGLKEMMNDLSKKQKDNYMSRLDMVSKELMFNIILCVIALSTCFGLFVWMGMNLK